MTNAIAIQPYSGLEMAMSPAEAGRRWDELQAFVKEVMVIDVDYGRSFPEQPKPSLWQQGAQKLAEMYGLAHRFEWVEVVKDWEKMFFYFEVRCVLRSRRSGQDIGEGIGSCNSKESKYAYRWAFNNDVPPHLDKSKMVQRTRKSKKPPFAPYTMYRIDNDDMASQVNTLQKMAAKRAYVHAVISVTRSSGLFMQDVEDLPPEVFGEVDEDRAWEKVDPIEEALRKKETSEAPTNQASATGGAQASATGAQGMRSPGMTPHPPVEAGTTPATPSAKIEIKMPKAAQKQAPKPSAADAPFGNAEQEKVSQKESSPAQVQASQGAIPIGQPILDWPAHCEKLKQWITEAYNQPEAGPRNTVATMVKRFVEGPPFPPSDIADELNRFLKVMSGATK